MSYSDEYGHARQIPPTHVVNWSLLPRPRPSAIDLPENALPGPQPKGKRRGRPDLRVNNAADDEAELFIYDEITDPLWAEFGLGISAAGFANELKELRGKRLTVHINSPGGSVFEGTAIYNLLRGHDAPVNVIVDGIAASIASVIAMAGDTVTMAPHSMLMIHDAWGITMGNAEDHQQQAAVLDKLSDNIAGVYAERGDKRVNWRAKMKAESWITAEEAVSLKLADRIDTSSTPAQAKFDLSRFRNVPPDLAAAQALPEPTLTERDAERVLRDAGFSRDQAKTIVGRGWPKAEEWDAPEADAEPATESDGESVPEIPEAPAAEMAADPPAPAHATARARELVLMEAQLSA